VFLALFLLGFPAELFNQMAQRTHLFDVFLATWVGGLVGVVFWVWTIAVGAFGVVVAAVVYQRLLDHSAAVVASTS
jgi:hypothetical protein